MCPAQAGDGDWWPGARAGDGKRPRERRPARFLVDEGESVTGLVRAALRCEGRMPLLGVGAANFFLYTTMTNQTFSWPMRGLASIDAVA